MRTRNSSNLTGQLSIRHKHAHVLMNPSMSIPHHRPQLFHAFQLFCLAPPIPLFTPQPHAPNLSQVSVLKVSPCSHLNLRIPYYSPLSCTKPQKPVSFSADFSAFSHPVRHAPKQGVFGNNTTVSHPCPIQGADI